MNRAQQSFVQAMIVFSTDYEKQEAVMDLCKQYSGCLYAALGKHKLVDKKCLMLVNRRAPR